MGGNTLGNAELHEKSAHHSLAPLYEYFVAAIEDRRREPRSDVLTGMAQSTFPDGTVPEPIEVARIASNLFAAGQETTVRLLGTALQIIGDDPELQAALRADRSLIPRFLEETLRTEGPIKGAFRLVRRSTTLGGVDLAAGTRVLLLHAAANRDPRQFENPMEFSTSSGPTCGGTSRSATACTPARRAAGALGGPHLHRAAVRPDDGHRDLGGAPRPGRRPPLRLHADLHVPRPDEPAPRVHPVMATEERR